MPRSTSAYATASVKAVFREGFADPEMLPLMPYSEEVRRFMDSAIERLHAAERSGDGL